MRIITMFTIIGHMKRIRNIILALGITLAGVNSAYAQDVSNSHNFHFDAGFGARNQTPVVFLAGFGYKDAEIRIQGLGIHNGPNDFWCGFRGSLLWQFFRGLPYYFEAGVGGGYEYAEAPNKMHQALNDANNAMYALPYNYKEDADISIELWAHLYGFYTQISVPAYKFRDYDSANILWGAGFLVGF